MSELRADLLRRMLTQGTILFVLLAVLLFGVAGTLRWWQAWLFLAIYLAWTVWLSAWLLRHDPALLERRMRAGPWAETRPAQRWIMSLTTVGFIALIVVPALDRRFGWSAAPGWLGLLGDALFCLGLMGITAVFRVNAFTAATVEVMPGQTVTSTGPYAIVRHPMYAAATAMLAGIPLALASWWGLLLMIPLAPALVWRLLDEERMLARDLPGYTGYMQMVRYRLIPGIW